MYCGEIGECGVDAPGDFWALVLECDACLAFALATPLSLCLTSLFDRYGGNFVLVNLRAVRSSFSHSMSRLGSLPAAPCVLQTETSAQKPEVPLSVNLSRRKALYRVTFYEN